MTLPADCSEVIFERREKGRLSEEKSAPITPKMGGYQSDNLKKIRLSELSLPPFCQKKL